MGKYAIRNQEGLHFVTFTVVYWLDIFIRDAYRNIFYESLEFCQKNKGLNVYAYCNMSSHIHLIMSASGTNSLSEILKDLKSFTSRHIRKTLEADTTEIRKEWMLWLMIRAGAKNERNKDFQFWQQHNHPIELSTNEMIDQRLDYTYNNPIEAGFVEEAHCWLHSSGRDYTEAEKVELNFCFYRLVVARRYD